MNAARPVVGGVPEPSASEADLQEQGQEADGRGEDRLPGSASGSPVAGIGVGADRPEADVLEQAIAVVEEGARPPTSPPADVPEADWLEQSIGEPVDDEDQRD